METAALLIALVALLCSWLAWRRSAGQTAALEEVASSARRTAQQATAELQVAFKVQQQLLARLAGGEQVSREMVLEGQLWRELSAQQAQDLLLAQREVYILDVRTPAETRAGILPNAHLCPLDELEARAQDVPRNGRPILVYCAAGMRSAAACEFLTRQGLENLYNLEGGFSAWTGPRVLPPP